MTSPSIPARVLPAGRPGCAMRPGCRVPTDRGLRINNSAAVLQAAIDGQGVALARSVMAHDDLAAGRLVRAVSAGAAGIGPWRITWCTAQMHCTAQGGRVSGLAAAGGTLAPRRFPALFRLSARAQGS